MKYFTSYDVELHNCAKSCWVSLWGHVLDLTDLINENRGIEVDQLLALAGDDISHLFDEKTKNLRTRIDVTSGLPTALITNNPLIHAPPITPTSETDTGYEHPWWMNEKYRIGKLTSQPIYLKIINTLTSGVDFLVVSCEDKISDIQNRYLTLNTNALCYTWKSADNNFIPLEMNRTLCENIPYEIVMDCASRHIPLILHLYYNDDLTEKRTISS